MASPQDQNRAVASSSSTGAMITDQQRCDSPRQSMSDAGHSASDHSTLAEKEEDDVVKEPVKDLPRRPTPIRTSKPLRRDSWMSNQLSPTGTFFDPVTHEPFRPNDNFPILFTESPSEEKSLAHRHPRIAEPIHNTHRPPKKIKPCFPTLRNRYDRGVAVPRNEESWEFDPLETFTVHDVYCDRRWSPNTHPEGQLYFSSARKDGQHLYLTEEHLYEQKHVDEMEQFIMEFERRLDTFGHKLSEEFEIFVAFDECGEEGWYYYCVDTARRCLFWIDRVDLTWMAETVGSVPTKAHLKYGLDYEYWIHVEHFPFHQTIPDSLIHDLLGVAIHQSVDSMTSLDSTVPFSKEETQQLVSLVKHLHTLKKTENSHGYIVVAAARLMTILVNERFFHFAGQHGARLTRDQSIRGKESKRTYLIRLLSPILFYAPETHLTSLEKIWVDETIKAHPWKSFITRLEEDWIQYVLYSTVLLTADVSFLAVPNVMPNNGIPQGQAAPPAVVATQISLIAAMGSIVVGLLLVREHRKKASESAQVAADFLRRRSHPNRGLEAMAILYSLPFALLMWGMGSFLVALGVICFVFAVNGLIPTILYAIVWGFVSLMIIFTILSQLEARMSLRWNQFKVFRWVRWFKRLAWWKKKSKEEEEEEEIEMDRRSISTNADSVRSMRTRMKLDFFMRRKKDSRRDTVFDLAGR
ncbi:hypothetical protein SCHPADRAFT_997460 [Schizopora paradoxa]|uniref:WW domain-containing protein n=1 Tax=Schizopora paradoxa TaxID=27342 RepID=A0A0H2RP20_9AGAM|nr:hypothetical protein SCHPADRAFT_997460 [Schizopora paradoxa]